MKKFLIFLVVNILITQVFAQEVQPDFPKRDTRSVWMSYLDIKTLNHPRKIEQAFNKFKDAGINTIYFHVRAFSDAFYDSSIDPWTDILSGTQGTSPGYDPLAVAVEVAHEIGLELHAWVNPLRSHTSARLPLADSHIYIKHPEWVMEFTANDKYILNPGFPEARAYVVSVIRDMIENYDIDGVIYDDYFYPYPDGGHLMSDATDQTSFDSYNPHNLSRSNWRRDNTRKLIQETYDVIQEVNSKKTKFMTFGVSPFGIYKRGVHNITASNTLDGYNDIYIDPLQWLKDGYKDGTNKAIVDYLSPQLYWSLDSKQEYDILANWWDNYIGKYNRYHYVSMASSNVDNGNWEVSELLDQIAINREAQNENTLGQAFFTSTDLLSSDISDPIVGGPFKYPSVPPAMTWINDIAPNNVTDVSFDGSTVSWTSPVPTDEGIVARKYIIYAFDESDDINIQKNNGTKIIGVTGMTSFAVDAIYADKVIIISALDAVNNESVLATVDGALAIEDNEAIVLVNSIYPNPVNDNGLNINLNNANSEISIVSIEGREVYKGFANSKSITVDTYGWNKGLYLVMVSSENNTQVVKVLKK